MTPEQLHGQFLEMVRKTLLADSPRDVAIFVAGLTGAMTQEDLLVMLGAAVGWGANTTAHFAATVPCPPEEALSLLLDNEDQNQKSINYARQETTLRRIREVARSKGYAIAVHGSRQRDLDLIAAPWTDEAQDADALLEGLLEAGFIWGPLNEKPHGRVGYQIHGVTGCQYVDLSIMPRMADRIGEITPDENSILVLKIRNHLPMASLQTLKDDVNIELGDRPNKVIILDGGTELLSLNDEMLAQAGLRRIES